jgi:ubiquilin
MGAPPTDDMLASMLDDPNMRQTMNEALNNPDLVNMMIQNTPALRNMPGAREMLQSPMMREMLTNPDSIRQAAAMRRSMAGAGGAGGFPAPGVTDTTPAGAAGSTPGAGAGAGTGANVPPFNPFAFGGAAGANPFAQLFGAPGAAGNTPAPASAGQPPATGADPNAPNPFASLFGGAGAGGAPGANPLFPNMPAPTPEQMRQTLEMLQNGGFDLFGGAGGFGGGAGGGAGAAAAAAPADTRPPEERYADQLRQLNDMGFFDFDRNVEALRRSGGSVQGAIEQLLS